MINNLTAVFSSSTLVAAQQQGCQALNSPASIKLQKNTFMNLD